MRKIKAFSANMSFSTPIKHKETRSTYNDTEGSPRKVAATPAPVGEVSVFMTKSLIEQNIKDMKKSINIRFLQLIKAVKSYSKGNHSLEEISLCKKFVTMQLTMMLGEYVNMLDTNASLQLQNYLKINSVIPEVLESCRVLSKVMIKCNRIRKANGTLPPRNQHDLNRSMNNFINDVIEASINGVNVGNPFINESISE